MSRDRTTSRRAAVSFNYIWISARSISRMVRRSSANEGTLSIIQLTNNFQTLPQTIATGSTLPFLHQRLQLLHRQTAGPFASPRKLAVGFLKTRLNFQF